MINLLNVKIKTSRLLLLPITTRYKQEIFKEFTEEITVYMNPEPAKDISETEDFINKSIRELKKGDNLILVVLNKISKEFLGCIGLHHINRNTPELGIWLKDSAHGHKYGQEAMKALKKWADENLTYEYLLYPVADKNIASRKIPELLGGKIAREYDKEVQGSNKYHWLEYRIYANKK
jgi:RimJ/RimL family protein N-acetyltransferase